MAKGRDPGCTRKNTEKKGKDDEGGDMRDGRKRNRQEWRRGGIRGGDEGRARREQDKGGGGRNER